MTPELLGAMLAHARVDAPRESCGLLIAAPENLAAYVPCRNIAGDGEFQIHPEDWAKAEDSWQVLGVVHSHPSGNLEPSECDLVNQRTMGLPWWIVSPGTSEWRRFGASPEQGRSFAWGAEDCFSLVRDRLNLSGDYLRSPDFWRERDIFEDCRALAGFKVVTDPEPGDVMLFAIRCQVSNHCAVYMGEGRILHHLPGRLSIEEPIGAWVQCLKSIVRRAA